MSASDAAPLPRLGEVFFDVRGDSRSMRLSWYADTGVAVFSIWQGGTCTGTFRLPVADLPRMVQILQRGPHGEAGQAGHEVGTGQHSAAAPPGGQHGAAAAPGGRHSGSHARPPRDEPAGIYQDEPAGIYHDEPTGIYQPADDWTPPGYVPGSHAAYQEEPPPGYRDRPSLGYQDRPPPGYQDGPPPGYFEEPPGFGGTGEAPGYGDSGEFGPGSYDESPVRPYVTQPRDPADEHAGESFPYRPPAQPPPRRRPRNPGRH